MGQVLREVVREFGPAPTRFDLRLELTDEWPQEAAVSAAHCLAFAGDRMVLAKHVDREWTIPGGHVEAGETVEEAMRREALEEAGAVVGRATLFAVERIQRLSGPPLSDRYTEPAFQVFFVAPLVSLGEPSATEECTESRLFAPDEARVAPGWVQQLPAFYEAALAWATEHLCGGCGFVYDEGDATTAAHGIRTGAGEVASVLGSAPEPAVRRRPSPEVWSALEYACHLRDVLFVQRERIILGAHAPAGEPPSLVPMLRDERAGFEGYADAAVEDVARQLVDAAALFANVLDRLDDASWSRTVLYNYPDVRERTLRWVAVHTLHEVRHHLADVTA